ncbi:MAG TPA: glycosyltransferase family 87 protein [Patescibacteria group bacterium]|nr:glycosyltransferase family 87 protein [Patescibacteria group bacterium]
MTRAVDGSLGQRWHFGVPTLLLAVSTGICVQILVLLTVSGGDPVDALCFWLTNPANPYNRVQFAFGYSPVAAQLGAPLFQLPFPAFAFLLRLLEVASLVFLTGPLAGALIFTTPVASEINAANINLPLAVIMVLGFRWPALWAIPLLTKPSMGVGLLWFALRGEWRKLAIPVGIAGALAVGSFLFDQRVWFEWVQWLRDNPPVGEWPYPYPVWARLPISVALVVWGARTNRPWTVALASALALPRLYYQSPAILIALVPLIPWLGKLVVPWTRRIARIDEILPARSPRHVAATPIAQPGASASSL